VLVEPQRTNLLLRSQEFDNAAWSKTNVTISPDSLVSPDGTSNADYLIENTATTTHIVRKDITFTEGIYTFSIYAKAGLSEVRNIGIYFNTSVVGVLFNITNGEVLSSLGSVISIKSTQDVNGWWRFSFTASLPSGIQNCRIYLGKGAVWTSPYEGDGVSGIFIWQAQIEEGTEATSIIPTTSATVTRNEDVIDVTTPAGVTEIVETFADGTTNTETTIPATYQLPQGEIKSIVMT
jgi:hypothetical protein